MKNHLISGGCGFVGRNMVKRLYKTTQDRIIFIDDLSVGRDPETWLEVPLNAVEGNKRHLVKIRDSFLSRRIFRK